MTAQKFKFYTLGIMWHALLAILNFIYVNACTPTGNIQMVNKTTGTLTCTHAPTKSALIANDVFA